MKDYIYIKEVEVPLYRGTLVLVFSNSSNELKNHFDVFSKEQPYAHTLIGDWKGKQGFAIILNFHNQFRKITNGVIAHEAIHASNAILESRGVLPSFENDESSTYLTEWIVDEIYNFMNQYKFKAKPYICTKTKSK